MSISVNFIELANRPLTEPSRQDEPKNTTQNNDNVSYDTDDNDNQSYSLSDIGSLSQIFTQLHSPSKSVRFGLFDGGSNSHNKQKRLTGHEDNVDIDPYYHELEDASTDISTTESNIGLSDDDRNGKSKDQDGSKHSSRQETDTYDVVNLAKSARNCCGFTMFVVVFMTLAVMSRSFTTDMYYATTTMRQTLIDYPRIDDGSLWETGTFEDITQISQIWDYLENAFVPSILVETDYNGEAIVDKQDTHLVGDQLMLLGGIKIRIQNIKQATCTYLNVKVKCFDNTQIDSNSIILTNGDSLEFKTAAENEETESWAGRMRDYSGDGNVLELPTNLTQAKTTIEILKNSKVISRGTRLMVIDFNSFAVSNGLHTVSRIAFEFSDSGGIIPIAEIRTWRFLKYEGDRGIGFMAIEILFVLCVIWVTQGELSEIYSDGLRTYVQDGWNYLDLINICLYWVDISMRASFAINYSKIDWLATKQSDANSYVPLFEIQREILNLTYIEMISSFVLILKFFKYFEKNPRLSFLLKIFNYSKGDLFVFLIVLGVFVIAFGISAFLLFSSDVQDFNTFGSSMFNLIRFLVSDMEISDLTRSNPVVGAIFFCFWGIMMILILSNVFIAIISAAYEAVAEELKGEKLGFMNATKALANSMRLSSMLKNRKSMKIVASLLKDIKIEELSPNENQEVTIDSILNHPKCVEYQNENKISETELREILTKVIDINQNGLISVSEMMTYQAAISDDNPNQLSNNENVSSQINDINDANYVNSRPRQNTKSLAATINQTDWSKVDSL